MFIKPVAGRKVPDPERGGFLPESGREVVPHQFWLKRIEDGDVVETMPEAEPHQSAVAAEAEAQTGIALS